MKLIPALLIALAFAAIIVATGCDTKPAKPPEPASTSPGVSSTPKGPSAKTPSTPASPSASAPDTTGWPTTIRVGLVPSEGGADTKARYAPLRDCLEKHLGKGVELITASSYQAVVTAMANNQIEFAYFGPKSYVEAAKRAGAEALVVELNKEGERGYKCVFIVPTKSDITDLKSAKGKRFAFTDPNSTTGYFIPAMILLDTASSSAEDYFGKVVYSGSHATSLIQVAAGELDIAATNDLDMEASIARGVVRADSVRVVYTSDLIPGSLMAGRRDLPESLKKAFTTALVSLTGDKEALKHLQNGGFEPVTDREYDVIRASMEFLEKHSQPRKGGPGT